MPNLPQKVTAKPAKRFFVSMITRDIQLEDCILDLIDNSVDSAAAQSPVRTSLTLTSGPDLGGFRIDIEASEHRFGINDNCGGLTLDRAVDYAFTFGRETAADTGGSYGIGVYGIGMKRAIFKIGTKIVVTSTYAEGPTTQAFRVPIDVTKWLERPGVWDFDLESAAPASQPGLQITIEQLHPPIAATFADPGFMERLRRLISRCYALHLHRGLQILLNGKPVAPWSIGLLAGQDFAPLHSIGNDSVERQVQVEILAGMSAKPPEDAEAEDATAKDDPSGWFVFCNGRLVLSADKTELSGWGLNKLPKWHPQYSGFSGFVFFSSEDPLLLPLTTTKRGVDVSSPVYLRARKQMRSVTEIWVNYTNQRKHSIDAARDAEQAVNPVDLFSVGSATTPLKLPAYQPAPDQEPMANVLYSQPVSRVRRLATAYGNINMPYREVGIRTFDDAFARKVGQ